MESSHFTSFLETTIYSPFTWVFFFFLLNPVKTIFYPLSVNRFISFSLIFLYLFGAENYEGSNFL